MSEKQYDALDTLPDLDGGVFARQLSAAMAKTAMAVVQQEGRARKGKVTIELTFERLGETGTQVNLSHKLAFVHPTQRGKAAEDLTSSTVMYVNGDGALNLLPFKQTDLFKQPA